LFQIGKFLDLLEIFDPNPNAINMANHVIIQDPKLAKFENILQSAQNFHYWISHEQK
jgi:hypothetical protein